MIGNNMIGNNMVGKNIKIAIAQINLWVGDIVGNQACIMQNIGRAKQEKSDIIIFPELAITAYPPEDLLFRKEFHQKIALALQAICMVSHEIDIIIGYPILDAGKLYNSCSLIRAGKIVLSYHKNLLPNYGVFDEKRYFQAGDQTAIFDLHGVPVALSICEDIWQAGPTQRAQAAGAKIMININASPYELGKQVARTKMLQARAQQSNMDIIYANLVGAQEELVFDGGSMAVNHTGKIILRAPQFIENLYFVNYLTTHQDRFFIDNDCHYQTLSEQESVYSAIVLGVTDYVRKNKFTGVVIGLSGGIDSALTLCVAKDAVGADNVEVIIMPSKYTAAMSIEDATWQAKKLGVQYSIMPITQAFGAFNNILEQRFGKQEADISSENIQARCRGVLLMAVSNKTGKLVLTTGNKSELSVGYTTLYGDMAGGFAPLKDLSKTMVRKLATWCNTTHQTIPQRVIDRPPSAELGDNQKDEDTLPAYPLLDQILEKYIEYDQSLAEIVDAGIDADVAKQVIALVDNSEYKRRQAAPGVKISQRDLGRDRRYPINFAERNFNKD